MASLVLGHLFFLRYFYCEFEFPINRGHHGSQNTMGHLTGHGRDEMKEHAKGGMSFLIPFGSRQIGHQDRQTQGKKVA